jgi:hypothetical protein
VAKQLGSNKQIVKHEPQPLQVSQPVDEKAEVISGYLEKFASISGRALTPQVFAVYIEALSGFDTRRIEKGLKAYLERGTAWPWPGTLAEFIEDEI